VEPGLARLIVGVILAAVSAAFFAAMLLSLRLLRMSEWRQASLRSTWRVSRTLIIEYMACEAAYVAIAAIAMALVGPKRPVNFDLLSHQHHILSWIGFGIFMTLFGTRLLSGAVERLFPELDESAAKQQERWRKRLEIRAGEITSSRDSLLRGIIDSHFVVNAGPLEDERNEIRVPILWAVQHDVVKFERIQQSFESYLRFTDLTPPKYFSELVDQIRRGGVDAKEYAEVLVEKIVFSGQGVALKRLADDCAYMRAAAASETGDNQEDDNYFQE
jgi:hypothetical protein